MASPHLAPARPIDRLVRPLEAFLHIESASGVLLLVCAVAAMVLANSPAAGAYEAFWKMPVGFRIGDLDLTHALRHWINDGLMAIFFFLVGLEVKRELVLGELRTVRRAALPIAAALGGMLAPAGIYLALQYGRPGQSGWGIPMATDIAFVVGCMALLGPRVPHGFRITILSLAIVDDIGAILVIALGYSSGVQGGLLVLAAAGLALVVLCARLGIRSPVIYVGLGTLVWFAFHESGVHATLAGVLLGLLTPTRAALDAGVLSAAVERARELLHGEGGGHAGQRAREVRRMREYARASVSPVEYLEAALHPWVAFGIMPLFALANAGVAFQLSDLGQPIALAVTGGLLVGKPLGIVTCSWLAVRTGVAELPAGVTWRVMSAGGLLAGVGFTMALFIAGLALEGAALDHAKIGILSASLVAAVGGTTLLALLLPAPPRQTAGDLPGASPNIRA